MDVQARLDKRLDGVELPTGTCGTVELGQRARSSVAIGRGHSTAIMTQSRHICFSTCIRVHTHLVAVQKENGLISWVQSTR